MFRSLIIIPLCLLAILPSGRSHAQELDSLEILRFRAYEDTLNAIGEQLVGQENSSIRTLASHHMVKVLVRALKHPWSYRYPFDNLTAISVVKPEDDRFRVFSWQLVLEDLTCRYFGTIQMNGQDLDLRPLVDYSPVIDHQDRMVTSNDRWIGALYYDIRKTGKGKDVYYTLFGYQGATAMSNRKLLDVIWFTEEGEVRMGAPIFAFGEDSVRNRVIYEYKEGAAFSLRYDDFEEMIVMDHLIPVDDNSEGFYFNYVPDGSYDGFEWKKGKWQFREKLYDFKLEDGQAPNTD